MADEEQENQQEEESQPRYSAGIGIKRPATLNEMDVDGALERQSWGS